MQEQSEKFSFFQLVTCYIKHNLGTQFERFWGFIQVGRSSSCVCLVLHCFFSQHSVLSLKIVLETLCFAFSVNCSVTINRTINVKWPVCGMIGQVVWMRFSRIQTERSVRLPTVYENITSGAAV